MKLSNNKMSPFSQAVMRHRLFELRYRHLFETLPRLPQRKLQWRVLAIKAIRRHVCALRIQNGWVCNRFGPGRGGRAGRRPFAACSAKKDCF